MTSRNKTLSQFKAQSYARENEERKKQERDRNLLVLINEYLTSKGYYETAERLQAESRSNILKRFELADNIDLPIILQEFETFHFHKYAQKAKIVRKIRDSSNRNSIRSNSGSYNQSKKSTMAPTNVNNNNNNNNERKHNHNFSKVKPTNRRHKKDSFGKSKSLEHQPRTLPPIAPTSDPNISLPASTALRNFAVTHDVEQMPSIDCTPVTLHDPKLQQQQPLLDNDYNDKAEGDNYDIKILKPLPNWGSELRSLAEGISRDILDVNPNVHWSDIAGLDFTKQILQEAVVLPARFPQLFVGILSPWRGVLLFGPPGTGKTLLAKAVATECKTTFFNISASSLISKWRGESEKLIRVLFDLARYHAPSTIFIDEMDAIMTSRTGSGEHEASRRMKTELLIQMDGLSKTDDRVFVLAASNVPWALDQALLRRLEKRILVPLPDLDARYHIVSKHLLPRCDNNHTINFKEIAEITNGYSGADLVSLCKEISMRSVRRLMKKLSTFSEEELQTVEAKLEPVQQSDIRHALSCTKPSTNAKLTKKYETWFKEFGSTMNEDEESIDDE